MPQGEYTERNCDSQNRGAIGAAVEAEIGAFDDDLIELIKAWPELVEAIKAEILAMVSRTGPTVK